MALSIRSLIAGAIPTLAALIGFLWFRRKKKDPAILETENETAKVQLQAGYHKSPRGEQVEHNLSAEKDFFDESSSRDGALTTTITGDHEDNICDSQIQPQLKSPIALQVTHGGGSVNQKSRSDNSLQRAKPIESEINNSKSDSVDSPTALQPSAGQIIVPNVDDSSSKSFVESNEVSNPQPEVDVKMLLRKTEIQEYTSPNDADATNEKKVWSSSSEMFPTSERVEVSTNDQGSGSSTCMAVFDEEGLHRDTQNKSVSASPVVEDSIIPENNLGVEATVIRLSEIDSNPINEHSDNHIDVNSSEADVDNISSQSVYLDRSIEIIEDNVVQDLFEVQHNGISYEDTAGDISSYNSALSNQPLAISVETECVDSSTQQRDSVGDTDDRHKSAHNNNVTINGQSEGLEDQLLQESSVAQCTDEGSSMVCPTEMESRLPSSVSPNNFDAQSEVSSDSGKGTSLADSSATGSPNNLVDYTVYEFDFPSMLCGRLIGKQGKNINVIKAKCGAEITLKRKNFVEEFQSCCVEGTHSQVTSALELIKNRFPPKQYPELTYEQTNLPLEPGPVLLAPEIMQLSLPEGVTVDVVVSSVVACNHVFLQQPTHPTFSSLDRLVHCMNVCYGQEGIVPQLPRPIEVGVICAAPMFNGWFRAQVVSYFMDTDECDIKYVDYGGYMRVQACLLRQIRSDFTTLPFQAVECYMANVAPLKEELSFPKEASAVLEDLVQGQLLQSQVVAHEEDGVPYVQIYTLGDRRLLLNRELVNLGVARWMEMGV